MHLHLVTRHLKFPAKGHLHTLPVADPRLVTTERRTGQAASWSTVHNNTIYLADGLTVPFALTARLSALGSIRIVVIAGLAALFSGASFMGLSAYLASATGREHFEGEERCDRANVQEKPQEKPQEAEEAEEEEEEEEEEEIRRDLR